jgi:hypothetical protein
MILYSLGEAIDYLTENKEASFINIYKDREGSLTLKFNKIGVLEIRNKHGSLIDIDVSTCSIYKWRQL